MSPQDVCRNCNVDRQTTQYFDYSCVQHMQKIIDDVCDNQGAIIINSNWLSSTSNNASQQIIKTDQITVSQNYSRKPVYFQHDVNTRSESLTMESIY